MIFGVALFALLAQAAPAAPAAQARPSQPVTKAVIQAQIKASFDRRDTNKDGSVDAAEDTKAVQAALADANRRRSERVNAEFAKLDTNKDNSISKAEFDAAAPRLRAQTGNAFITSNDADKNGRVTLQEATARAMASFDRMDRDKNGVVSLQEAQAAQRPQQQPAGR